MLGDRVHVGVGVQQVTSIKVTLRGPAHAVGHLRVWGRRVAPSAQLLGIVREPLVQPQHLTCAAPQEHVLIEADHVLELMNERHGHECLNIRGRVRTTERSGGVGDDGIEDLALVRPRSSPICGIEIGAKEKSRDETAAGQVALLGRHQLVHRVGHQDQDDRVRIDVRLPPKGRCVDRVQALIEEPGDAVERGGIEATRRRQRVDIDDHFGRSGAHPRHDAVEPLAGGRRAHLKDPPRVHPWRAPRGRELGAEALRRARFGSKAPGTSLVTQPQIRMKALGRTQLGQLLGRGRRRGGQNRIAAQPEPRRLTRHAGRELGNQEVFGWHDG